MRLSIIGAGGFVGQRIARLAVKDDSLSGLMLCDTAEVPPIAGAGTVTGSFTDAEIRARATEGADAVILLASILGGAAEADYASARKVNVDATLDLFEYLGAQNPATRVVLASSIAVFAKPLPDPVNDATPTGPTMVYGAQKLMMEVALSNFSAKGWLDGVSLRLSGVMARDGADAALKTAFMSRLFWCVRRGEDITLPVSESGRTWLTSIDAAARNFLHAAKLPDLEDRRAFTLPALSVTFGELVAALKRRFPDSPSNVAFDPDPEIMSLFGSYPELVTETADRLGFRGDADIDVLVANSMN